MTVGDMDKHVYKIKNPKTRKIKAAQKIRDTFKDIYEQQLLKFPTAVISIDGDDNAIKELPKTDPNYVLYQGECCCSKKSHRVLNLLVIGPTGAGKTTLVDSFVNHVLGIDLYDNFRYKIVDERKLVKERMSELTTKGATNINTKTAQTMSITSSVTIYHIPAEHIKKKVSMEPCCINIIDTPGLGDSRGP